MNNETNNKMNLDEIANSEFGLDYDQLGRGEQEWCRDEQDNQNY